MFLAFMLMTKYCSGVSALEALHSTHNITSFPIFCHQVITISVTITNCTRSHLAGHQITITDQIISTIIDKDLSGVDGSLAHLENSSLSMKQNLAHLDEVAARDASAQKHHLAHLDNHLDGKVEDKHGFRVPFHLPTLIGQPPAPSPMHTKYEEEEMVH